MMVTDISRIALIISALFVALACFFAVGRNLLKQKAENNLLRYMALCISKILFKGEDVFWDDLLKLYNTESKSLLGRETSLTYKQVEETLSTAKDFLNKYFPSESNKWQQKIKNARRSVPIDVRGELITFEKSKVPSPLIAAYREIVFFIPLVNIYAKDILKSESFWIGADILFPGFIVIYVFQILLQLALPPWAALFLATILIVFTFILCLVSVVRYVRTIRMALNIPKIIKELEKKFEYFPVNVGN